MTTALLDQHTHNGHILEFIGESYRFLQRLRQEEQQPSTEQANATENRVTNFLPAGGALRVVISTAGVSSAS